jgi:pimeloyl-ACP methyl ester carboxylesterase
VKILDSKIMETGTTIPCGNLKLPGDLIIPADALGVVIFAHGSGSSRYSPRNQAVASSLHERHIGTLLFDLLSKAEEQAEYYTRHLRFNIALLADRLVCATGWVINQTMADKLPLGYFGSSTGAAAALVAAARFGKKIKAVVSRGGRPDLADDALSHVSASTLLIVGGDDQQVIKLNEKACQQLKCKTKLEIVPGATHLFEEPGALEKVEQLAGDFFAEQFEAKEGT